MWKWLLALAAVLFMVDMDTTEVGEGVEMSVEEDVLTLRVDLEQDFGRSQTGKTVIVGKTGRAVPIPAKDGYYVQLTVYKYPGS